MKIVVGLDGIDEALARLQATPQQLARASKRTVAKGTRFAGAEMRRGLAAMLGVPQKALTDRKRIRIDPDKGLVWIGYNPIAAIYLGNARQTKSGVPVAGRNFEHAFLATMPTGHVGIYRRVGKSRLPIKEVTVPLTGIEQIADQVRQSTATRLPVIFQQELNYEVNVRGR